MLITAYFLVQASADANGMPLAERKVMMIQ
jgi:hypothetical protein